MYFITLYIITVTRICIKLRTIYEEKRIDLIILLTAPTAFRPPLMVLSVFTLPASISPKYTQTHQLATIIFTYIAHCFRTPSFKHNTYGLANIHNA